MASKRFPMKLRQLREAKGLSQAALAEKVGVSREYIARLETGHHDPPLGTIERLAKALSVKVTAMLDDDRYRYLTNAAEIETILGDAFPPPLTIYTFDDRARSTKGYRIAGADIKEIRHRIDVSREFLVDHPASEITSLLREWRLIEAVRAAGLAKVLVTNKGVEVIGTKK